jgi:ubiquinone/menaquinone biosynthesis C-methylase UbiE
VSTNDYSSSAAHFALRQIVGSDTLAFQLVAERIASLKPIGLALDLGCGAGRSTRFLKRLGLNSVGVDASEAMIVEARRSDPDGAYHLIEPNASLPFADETFELLISSWVIVEICEMSRLLNFVMEATRVLSRTGTAFIVANTPEFYAGRWVSCEVDFPENKPPLRSGQVVKARLTPENVVVTDTYWSDEDYQRVFTQSGLTVVRAWKPIASQPMSLSALRYVFGGARELSAKCGCGDLRLL